MGCRGGYGFVGNRAVKDYKCILCGVLMARCISVCPDGVEYDICITYKAPIFSIFHQLTDI